MKLRQPKTETIQRRLKVSEQENKDMASKKKMKPVKKKKKNRMNDWTDTRPEFRKFSPQVREYLYKTGLAVASRNFSDISQTLYLNTKPLISREWETEKEAGLQLYRIAERLELFLHQDDEMKGSVLVFGSRADFYAGFMALIWPGCTFTVVSVDPATDDVKDLHLDEEESSRIQYMSSEDIAQQTYDTLVMIDLGNLWLYGSKADDFYSVKDYAQKLRQKIAPQLKELMGHLTEGGSFYYLHQNLSDLAYPGIFLALDAWTEDGFALSQSVTAGVTPDLNRVSVLLSGVRRTGQTEMDNEVLLEYFPEELVESWEMLNDSDKRPEKDKPLFSKNVSFFERLMIEESGLQPFYGADLEVKRKDGETDRVRFCNYFDMNNERKGVYFISTLYNLTEESFKIFSIRKIDYESIDGENSNLLDMALAALNMGYIQWKKSVKILSETPLFPEAREKVLRENPELISTSFPEEE